MNTVTLQHRSKAINELPEDEAMQLQKLQETLASLLEDLNLRHDGWSLTVALLLRIAAQLQIQTHESLTVWLLNCQSAFESATGDVEQIRRAAQEGPQA